MFRFESYSHLKVAIEERHHVNWDPIPQNGDPRKFKPITHPEIMAYMKLVESDSDRESGSEEEEEDLKEESVNLLKTQRLEKIIKLAKDGDEICQEFLAFQYPLLKASEELLSEEEDVDLDIQIGKTAESEEEELSDENAKKSQHYNPRNMAKLSVYDHESPLGHYVLFKHYRQKGKIEKAANHLTAAIASNNPDVRMDLFLWLDGVNIGMIPGFQKYLEQLAQHSRLFGALMYFCLNEMNPFVSLTVLEAYNNSVRKELLASHLKKGDMDNAWKELEAMKKMEMIEAPDLVLLILVAQEVLAVESCLLLTQMINFKTRNADFEEYINNHPVLSHFVNEAYILQYVKFQEIKQAIFSEKNINTLNTKLQLINNTDAIVIWQLRIISSLNEEHLTNAKLINSFLNSIETDKKTASVFLKFVTALNEDNFVEAAQYFSSIAEEYPLLKAWLLLILLSFTNSPDFDDYLKNFFELKVHSTAFQQFVEDYATYIPYLNKEYLPVAESSSSNAKDYSFDSDSGEDDN